MINPEGWCIFSDRYTRTGYETVQERPIIVAFGHFVAFGEIYLACRQKQGTVAVGEKAIAIADGMIIDPLHFIHAHKG